MAELLLELFSEEIPARMQARAAEDLQRLVTDKLKAAGLHFTRRGCLCDAAPPGAGGRRAAGGAAGRDAKRSKGPRVGSPRQAIEGFLKGAGLDSARPMREARHRQGRVLFRRRSRRRAAATAEVLRALIVASHCRHCPGRSPCAWPTRPRALGAAAARHPRGCSTATVARRRAADSATTIKAAFGGTHARSSLPRSRRDQGLQFADYVSEAEEPRRSSSIPAERRAAISGAGRDAGASRGPDGQAGRGAAGRGDRPGRMAGRADGQDRPGIHGRAAGGADHLHAHATRNTSRCWTRPASWRRASWWSPTWRPRTAARRSSPATSGCCAPGSPTPSSSGSRTRR